MKGKVIRVRYTRGDYATRPGGIILRELENGEFVAHNFCREYGSTEPVEFFWGHYSHEFERANKAFEAKVESASRYSAGGSLIPANRLVTELEQEKMNARQSAE